MTKLFKTYQHYITAENCITYVVSRSPKCWLHISLSRTDRHPTWQEIKDAKMRYGRNESMAIYLPPPCDYINRHENCIHLYEVLEGDTQLAKDRKEEVTDHAELHLGLQGAE